MKSTGRRQWGSERNVQNNIFLSKINVWVFPKHYRESNFTVIIRLLMGHRENFKYTNKRNLQTDDEWSWQTVAGWKLQYNLDRFTFQKLTINLSKYDVFEFLSWCSRVGLFKFVHKLLSSFKIRARISEIRVRIFSFVFANSYANSHVNFVHEIRNFW